ncbi:hypothetical protein [Rhodohalobacter sp.]|uniref:hypothetical protein n=1 Tax=Rhodohalobacter sp. TaxID=1974210 RepID=UPI003974A082
MKLKICYLICFILLSYSSVMGQESYSNSVYDKETFRISSLSLVGGYVLNTSDSVDRVNHFLEFGISKSLYSEPIYGNLNYHFKNELKIYPNDFVIGPKIGGYFGFTIFTAGLDLLVYTNFKNSSLRLVPNIGIGNHRFKFSINPHVVLTNSDLLNVENGGSFSFTMSILPLKTKKQLLK